MLRTALVMLLIATAAAARERGVPTERTVVVCAGSTVGFNAAPARNVASKMLHKIGVDLVWRETRNCPDGALRISFSSDTKTEELPGALAYALPYEGTHIVVFWDRVQHTVEPKRFTPLLAHVMVHEITHILQRTTHHSPGGVMKANWDRLDYTNMAWRPLEFDPIDIELVRSARDPGRLHSPDRIAAVEQADNLK